AGGWRPDDIYAGLAVIMSGTALLSRRTSLRRLRRAVPPEKKRRHITSIHGRTWYTQISGPCLPACPGTARKNRPVAASKYDVRAPLTVSIFSSSSYLSPPACRRTAICPSPHEAYSRLLLAS